MSNHSGSYMLNSVLLLCDRFGILEGLEESKRYEFIHEILCIGNGYDCNSGEILEEISTKYNICYCCRKQTLVNEEGICKECGGEFEL